MFGKMIIIFFQWLWRLFFGKKPAALPAPVGTPVSAAIPVAGDYMTSEKFLAELPPVAKLTLYQIMVRAMASATEERERLQAEILKEENEHFSSANMEKYLSDLMRYLATESLDFIRSEILISDADLHMKPERFKPLFDRLSPILKDLGISFSWSGRFISVKRAEVVEAFRKAQAEIPPLDIDEKMRTMLRDGPYR
jgi:hypothetical protein